MAGHGKSFVWQDYQTAFEIAYKEGMESADDFVRKSQNLFDASTDIRVVDTFENPCVSPETAVIKKDLISQLSEEAKEIILIVLEGPKEVIEAITSEKYNCISKQRIKQYLEKKGWRPKTINRCFEELKHFSEEIV